MQKLWLHFNEHQRFLLRNVSIIVIGLFINQLLQTVGSIIIARMVNDPVQFGEVNLLLQIFGMIALFLNVGFNSALVYTFSTNTQEAVQNKFRYALAGSTFFGIVISFIVAALSPLLASVYRLPALQTALVLGSIMFIFNSIVNMGVSSFSGNRNFATQAVFMVIMTTFSTLGTIAGVLWPLFGDHDVLWGISFWMGIGAVLTAMITSWRVHAVHRPRWFGPLPLSELREMMKYGVPLWAGNIAKAFQQPFLVMMIGSTSVVAVGHLANASRITGFIGIVTWAFMIVTFPFVAESSQNLQESKRRGTLCIRYNNIILYPLTLLICMYPDQINGFLFGAEYATGESAIYIRLLALGVFFSSVSRLGGNILAGIGRTKANFWVMIVAGIFVITLVPLIASNNPVLAVWIYTGGWAISALSMIWFFYLESFTLDWWEAYGEPLLPSALMGIMMEIGHYTGSGFPVFVVIAMISLIGMTAWIEARTKARVETHKKSA
ncbi:oligosaccharide flippase family protein [Paenibacillus sp. GD4]|uniref:oligosaccharide flippase family protein n=1 Tax=Paenibacillus sp. GD4 TaxID=3068890 RepID=UPI0027965762|nr:oligosaccharide flippase family protein [Paenibacillus sp. GD4]MDQ1908931.1 oligosaccharide flippase family protein [Paenibacillus sp. GD4]